MVFAAFMQMYTDTVYIVVVCPVGLAVHHHAVRGGSFVNFLGLVKLQG